MSAATGRRATGIEIAWVLGVFAAVWAAATLAGFALRGPLATICAVAAIFWRHKTTGLTAPLGLGAPITVRSAIAAAVAALALTVVVGTLIYPALLKVFDPVTTPSRFYQGDNRLLLVLSVITIAWLAAAFGEEVLMRGFLIPRLAALLGGSNGAWVVAVLIQGLLFGLLHGSPLGQIAAGLIGLGYGAIYVLGGRNLWPLIVAHAVPDTISLLGH